MTQIKIPCPHCTDGFVTSEDRHARTKQDVCKNCGGTGMAPARTGETAETSWRPGQAPDNAGEREGLAKVEKWLSDRVEAAHRDSKAHREGSNNRAFYFAQAIAYENAFSFVRNLVSQPDETEASRGERPGEASGCEPGSEGWLAAIEAIIPTPPLSPDSTQVRGQLIRAWYNPGQHTGNQGDRSRDEWCADAVLAVLTPSATIAAPVRDDGAHSKDFQLMLVRIIQRYRNGRDLTETLKGAEDLLKRKGSLSVFRSEAPAPTDDVPGEAQTERVRHAKRGTEYEVLGEATAQTGVVGGRVLGDYDKLIVYRCLETGKLWCRFTDEFRDGRFVTLVPGEAQTQEGWPAGCIKPNACARHRGCMYAMSAEKCRHYGKDLTDAVDAAARTSVPAVREGR
jgi:hypothetical protein